VPGYTPAPGESVLVGRSVVSPGYFHTLRVPLLAGREFTDQDDVGSPLVAVVNQAFAERYFRGRDPLGLTFSLGVEEARIVGVAKTGKYQSLSESKSPHFFLSTNQRAERNLTLAVRTSGEPSQLASAVARLAVAVDPNAPPHAAMSGEDYVQAAFTVPRVAAAFLSLLGFAALLLAGLGIYAVVSETVSTQIPELGLRVALGATPGGIMRLVLRDGLALAAVGLGGGALGGAAVCALLASLLVGTSSTDFAAWGLASGLLLAAVLAACWFPARRAARIDPMEALRCE
jgi:hypothetical protein